MTFKKLGIIVSTSALVTLMAALPVLAVDTTGYTNTANYTYPSTTTPPTPRPALFRNAGASTSAAVQADAVANLKARADQEIDRRITSLNNLITKINAMVRLSASQKTTFTNNIQADITNLTTLKTKIDADTDITTLRTDVKSIVSDYRVYLVFMPQINLLSYADRMSYTVTNMTTILTKLQARVSQAQSAGKNVGNAAALLTSAQNELNDANTQITNVINQVVPLTPAGYPGNETALKSARTTLQTVYTTDLVAGRQNLMSVIQILHGLGGTPTATSSAQQQ